MAATPESLVLDGRLAFRDIYRTAKLNERESVLVRGKSQDDFPDIVPHDPWNGTGVLRDCTKQLATGDELSPDQWRSLQVWHAGLSCQLKLKDGQNILFGLNDDNFLNEFNDLRRGGSMKVEGVKYRLFLVYQLPRGTVISNAIGIERDGENHVCLYPIGDDIAISDIENGLASFTIDVLRELRLSWRPFAVVRVRASGFVFPLEFPPDSDVFPFRHWLITVINYGDSDIAMRASNYTEDYTGGTIAVSGYLSKMYSIAKSYSVECDYDHITMNLCILKALSFALNANLLFEKNERYCA